MIQVIPAINAETWEEVLAKIKLVEPFTEWVHIDVADGSFTPNKLWANPLDLSTFETNLKIELHLMLSRPEDHLSTWFSDPVRRIIVHCEATEDMPRVIRECHAERREVGAAILPDTIWTNLEPFADEVDLFQLLAVNPGFSGQEFQPHILEKIRNIRGKYPNKNIEVDGGINPETAKSCVAAGANILVAASYIFNHKNPKAAIQELRG